VSTLDATLSGEAVGDTAGGPRSGRRRRASRNWSGWLFALPALLMYAVFVLRPMTATIQYSFYDWNGITPATPVGVDNYVRVLTDPALLSSVWHAFFLIILPILGLIETPKRLPNSITEAVLEKNGGKAAQPVGAQAAAETQS
jgi:ABC-type polysaccharide transport system permease subunit